MKLDYATLISPYPLFLKNIGHVKCPTLREIWNPNITYQSYQAFISLLAMTSQNYHEVVNLSNSSWYKILSNEEKENITVFDIIIEESEIQQKFYDVFNFFFVENIIWDSHNNIYITYMDLDENKKIIPTGFIYKKNFSELCDIILQKCGIIRNDSDIDISKIKNKRALEIFKKIQKARKQISVKHDKDLELPNIIAKVAVKAKSINYLNIWDLTVFQLQEQFNQECQNVMFDINSISVAAYGNEKNTFKGNEWYKNES